MARKKKRYTPAERARMLAIAAREGLTGAQAAKKFGISAVTYYAWKKRGGVSSGRTKVAVAPRSATEAPLLGVLQAEVRKAVRELLPRYLAREISTSVAELLGLKH